MMRLVGKLARIVKNPSVSLTPPVPVRSTSTERVQPLTDPGIETLSEVLDPITLAKHLAGVSGAPWNGQAHKEVQVRVLRHHVGQRCTLEIALRTQQGWHFMIGKVYQADCPELFQAMDGIQQAGFGPRAEFSIPQPLAYLASLRCFVQEKVEGPSAGDIFKTGDEHSRVAAAERCGRWLARFHAVGPRAGPVSYAHEHLKSKSMRRCSRKIAKLTGPFANKAAHLLQRLEAASSSLSPVELRAGHGSYSASHVILAEGRTVAIDWDFHEVADPACDLARFLGALRRRALIRLGSIRLLDGAAEAFLTAYLAMGPSGVEENLRFFEAATYLNLAMRHLSDPVPNCQENTEAMLDEGLRVLGREVI
jgi:aminoglycoside phosphotransferase (APT) family kinase protein